MRYPAMIWSASQNCQSHHGTKSMVARPVEPLLCYWSSYLLYTIRNSLRNYPSNNAPMSSRFFLRHLSGTTLIELLSVDYLVFFINQSTYHFRPVWLVRLCLTQLVQTICLCDGHPNAYIHALIASPRSDFIGHFLPPVRLSHTRRKKVCQM